MKALTILPAPAQWSIRGSGSQQKVDALLLTRYCCKQSGAWGQFHFLRKRLRKLT